MKTIRRTRIKIKQKELVIVTNEAPQVCPVCSFPIQHKVPFDDDGSVGKLNESENKSIELPANTKTD